MSTPPPAAAADGGPVGPAAAGGRGGAGRLNNGRAQEGGESDNQDVFFLMNLHILLLHTAFIFLRKNFALLEAVHRPA
jgi:hypothetical protein